MLMCFNISRVDLCDVYLTFIHISACAQSIMTLCFPCSPSCDVSYIALLCIHALHCCISIRYVRCMTWGWRTWCCNQPKDDVGGRIQKMEVPQEYISGKRSSPSEYHLTNTDLVLDPRQAPEHSKPPTSLLKYTWVYILYCALSIGAELKSVAACLTLSIIYIPVSLLLCIGRSMLSYA